MNTLYLVRHSLTLANEQRLYCGSTDLSLTENGRRTAFSKAATHPLPECAHYAASGMRRAVETLELLTGRKEFETIADLREMDFGAFEMHGYEQLRHDPRYIRWIEDATGDIACPGGESKTAFERRVLTCADALIQRDMPSLLVVCHGGVIASIMHHWFPDAGKHFYQWQPEACCGYGIRIADGRPVDHTQI